LSDGTFHQKLIFIKTNKQNLNVPKKSLKRRHSETAAATTNPQTTEAATPNTEPL